MKIIGLTGKARAGKDTAAGFILTWCVLNGLTADRVAFADPLKRSVAAALGFNTGGETDHPVADAIDLCNELKLPGVEIHIVDRAAAERDHELWCEGKISGREFLQLYGTEAHRDVFGKDFWVEVTEKKLNAMAGAVDVAVITDCRFPNEAAMVNKYDGEVWEVTRADNDTLTDGLEAHASEAGVPEGAIEFQILNDGDLGDLQALINSICESNLKGDA